MTSPLAFPNYFYAFQPTTTPASPHPLPTSRKSGKTPKSHLRGHQSQRSKRSRSSKPSTAGFSLQFTGAGTLARRRIAGFGRSVVDVGSAERLAGLGQVECFDSELLEEAEQEPLVLFRVVDFGAVAGIEALEVEVEVAVSPLTAVQH